MTIISLTTDFGLTNSFVGVMKGVIFGITPEAKIVDISHLIDAQNVRLGGLAVWRAVPYFPQGSIHIAVVDPGVGTQRRPLGARLGGQYFIAPDNGLLTHVILDAERNGETMQFIHLNNPDYWLPKVSSTFHGRDIFAPTGAHLAAGVPLREMGEPVTDPVRLDLSRPQKTPNGWDAHVALIDVFGNITTDLPAEALDGRTDILVRLGGIEVQGLVESYGHRQKGVYVALVDSEGYLEIAQVNGNAAATLGMQVDDQIEILFQEGGI